MIDTIKFRIPVSEEVFIKAVSKIENCTEAREGDLINIKKWQFPVKLPSSDRNVNVLGYRGIENAIFLEFCPVKLLYATNLIVPTIDDVSKAVTRTREALINCLGDIPETKYWVVTRIDLPVMWNYGTYDKAYEVLEDLRSFGTGNRYDTTVYKGQTMVFYLKSPEYLEHDGKWIKKNYDFETQKYFEDLSKPLLRFEVRLRGAEIYKNLRATTWDSIIALPESRFRDVVNTHLIRFRNGVEACFMTKRKALTIMAKEYGYDMAYKLIQYLEVRDGDFAGRKQCLDLVPRYTKSKWNKMIREAGVGVSSETSVEFPDINSPLLVSPGFQTALAVGIR